VDGTASLKDSQKRSAEGSVSKKTPVVRGHSLDRLMTATNPKGKYKGKYSAAEYRSLYRSPKRFQTATPVQEPDGEKEARHTAVLSVEEEQVLTGGRA